MREYKKYMKYMSSVCITRTMCSSTMCFISIYRDIYIEIASVGHRCRWKQFSTSAILEENITETEYLPLYT